MKKLVLKMLGIMIAMVVVLSSASVFAANPADQKKENEKQINEKKDNLEEVQEDKEQTTNEVEKLSSEIVNYQDEINNLDGKIKELQTQIAQETENLKKAEEEYKGQEKLFNERLITLYENGDTSYLDFLLASNGVTDLISNWYLVSELASYDTELLEKIANKKQEIVDTKNKIETSKTQIEVAKNDKQTKTAQLEVVKTKKNEHVASLSEEEKQIQEEIDELQEANVQIAKEIKQAQEQYAKQIAALNNKNKGNSGGSSSTGSGNSGSSGNSGGSSAPSGSGVLQKPVNSNNITAGMYYPSSGKYHGAIDYGVPIGTPVYAAAEGVVIKTANLKDSYGTYVVIQHAGGLQTWYAHGTPGSISVSSGQTVSRGQQIMRSGNSGNGGAHLHFEVRVLPYSYNGCRVNPAKYF